MRLKALSIAAIGALMAMAVVVQPVVAAGSTVIVTGNTSTGENEAGWLFNRDVKTSTPYEFNTDNASAGEGSLYVLPITNTNVSGTSGNDPNKDKFIAEYFYVDTLASFDSFAYDFKIAGSGTASSAEQFYMNVYTNLPGKQVTNYFDCRYDFVPTVGSTGSFTTFTVDKSTAATRVASRGGAICPPALDGLSGLPAGSTIRAFSVNVGDTNSADQGLAGYLDRVVVGRNLDTTTYDFEPTLSPSTKDECKNGNWAAFNTPAFTNQGQCVSWATANGNASFKRAN